MSEGDFWNNLDSFVEKQQKQQNPEKSSDKEKVDDWLKNVPDTSPDKGKISTKTKSPR
jgi:hypothetical protein